MTVPRLRSYILLAILGSGAISGPIGAAATEPPALQEDTAGVEIVLSLRWRNEPELAAFLNSVAKPQSPEYQQFLTAAEFEQRFGPSSETVASAVQYLREQGYEITDVSSAGNLISALRPGSTGAALTTSSEATSPVLPPALAEEIVGLQQSDTATDLRPPQDGPVISPQIGAPFTPADIARLYEFEPLFAAGFRGENARHSTIAVATAFGYAPGDLLRFWSEFAIDRDLSSVELIPVDGPITENHSETILDVEWASALAPAAPILVYAGAGASSSTFLKIYDLIVAENRAAVLTTSWGRCERDLPATYLTQANAIFQRAAAQGITVIAASGDAGAYGCGSGAMSVSFPASSPYALAVGGTTLLEKDDGIEETAWSGSGGGSSATWAAPLWQMQANEKRVMADVSLNADPATPYMTAYEDGWWHFGGTSVGAPIWAALIAVSNQYRASVGRPTLGLAAPALCELAYARDLPERPFRDVTIGDNTGYHAERGWDHPTGWGTPRAQYLARALAMWSPSDSAVGGMGQALTLASTQADVPGVVRLRFRRRCLTTSVSLRVRSMPAGTYSLDVDGEPVASFEVDGRGRAALAIGSLDPRGKRLSVSTTTGDTLFEGMLVDHKAAPVRKDAQMVSTGAAATASGALVYLASGGREQLTVYADGLPAGRYEIRLGSRMIGSLSSRGAESAAMAHFASDGSATRALPFSPLCQSVSVLRDGAAYLRAAAGALAPAECRS